MSQNAMTLLRGILLVALTGLALAVQGGSAGAEPSGPSFDCAKATQKAERLICDDSYLSAQDRSLALTYRDALAVEPKRADALKAEQIQWLRQRNKLCDLKEAEIAGGAHRCLSKLQDQRLQALEAESFGPLWQNAAQDPADALARLQPLRAPKAKLYAAYLAHALSSEDIKAFSNFVDDTANDVGDANSADGTNYEIEIPCSLAEKFPRLLLVGRAFFGSTKDNVLPDIACGDPKPRGPKAVDDFLQNDPTTHQNWFARCSGAGGTIFSAYARDLRLYALRLARFPSSYLSDELSWTEAPGEPWPTAEAIESADWTGDPKYVAAKTALAGFYRKRFGLSAAEAETAATRALWDNRIRVGNPATCLGEE